nr:RNA-dependent RNA polymerase [Flumine Astrovirus 6]
MYELYDATPIWRARLLQPLEDEESYQYLDVEVFRFFRERGLPIPSGFGVARAAWKNVRTALAKGDHTEVYRIPKDVERRAFNLLKAHYRHYFRQCRKVDYEAIKLNPDTAGGFPYNNMTKREVIYGFDEYLRWYLQPGNMDRPPPVFKVTPKVEYLSEEKLREHKLRLFRNPPLDFLLLEKLYFQEQEDLLNKFDRKTWSGLGFVKEFGGWNRFVNDLKRKKFFYRWDVARWDKNMGPKLSHIATELRREFYVDYQKEVDCDDWVFLSESAEYALELIFNGQIYQTGNCQKSGRLRTATDNTICHIFLLLCHYVLYCDEIGRKIDYDECLEEWINYVYSDDIQGSTNDLGLVEETRLRRTFQMVGMDVQEYMCSSDIESIHFLGAGNRVFTFDGEEMYVPHYDEARMFYAMVYTGGSITELKRAQRIHGLFHNVCFDERAWWVTELMDYLHLRGKWPETVPRLTVYEVQRSYLGAEAKEGRVFDLFCGEEARASFPSLF